MDLGAEGVILESKEVEEYRRKAGLGDAVEHQHVHERAQIHNLQVSFNSKRAVGIFETPRVKKKKAVLIM